jgi:hypothetical protein
MPNEEGIKELIQKRVEEYIYNKFKEALSEALILSVIFRNLRHIPSEEEIKKHYEFQKEINKFIIELIEKKKSELQIYADDVYVALLQLCVQSLIMIEQMQDERRKFISQEGMEFA